MNAPERIWAAGNDTTGSWNIEKATFEGPTETQYVRADLFDAQDERIKELELAIKRQAIASKTLRDLTLSEVQHLKDQDRSEYFATKTLDSEREANSILTDRVEHLEAKADTIKELTEALEVVTDDLEAEVYAKYPLYSLKYPHNVQKKKNDMEPVIAARAALAKAKGGDA